MFEDLNPWPVAYTTMDGAVLKVWQALKLPSKQNEAPGTIIEIENDGFIIATGNETAIKILELQPCRQKKNECGTIFKRRRSTFNNRDYIRGLYDK